MAFTIKTCLAGYIEAIKGADSGKWLKDKIIDLKGQYNEYGKSKPC